MSATIELAALIVRQCVDEGDRVYGIHPNTLRGMAIAAKNEHDSLRARIAELAGLVDENRSKADTASANLLKSIAREEAAHARIAELEKGLTFQRDRAERHLKALAKAEAERDEWRASRIETARQRDAFEIELRACRSERDRYLAAIVEMYRANLMIDAGRYHDSLVALRRIAEEAR